MSVILQCGETYRKPGCWAGWPWWTSRDGDVFLVDEFGELVKVERSGRALSLLRAARRDDPSYAGI